LRDTAGAKLTDEWLHSNFRNSGWYDLRDDEHRAGRVNRPPVGEARQAATARLNR
jgi:hypothetical protein